MSEASSIIVLGGPAAGKTVYASILYHHLWNGHEGMVMRAGSGAMHSELLKSAESIRRGKMPPATQALRHFEFELEHDRRAYHLRYLDYPGELFRRVFFDMAIDTDETREFLQMCQDAAGVVVLVDPQSVVADAAETDYALCNLFRFYESNGRDPKFVFALTKRDETEQLVEQHPAQFLKRYLPHTSRRLGSGMHIMHFASIIKTKHAVQLARAGAIKAPLDCILRAIEEEQIDRGREALTRRLAVRDTIAKVGWVVCAVLSVLGMFVLGILCRHFYELHRGPPSMPGLSP